MEIELIARGEVVGCIVGNPVTLPESEVLQSQSPLTNDFTPNKRNERVNSSFAPKIISPISSLNPFHNNWIIKARVINKTNIRNWCNSKGEGKLFSVDLVDQGGEIRCTAFRELVDLFFDRLEVSLYFLKFVCHTIVLNKYSDTSWFF